MADPEAEKPVDFSETEFCFYLKEVRLRRCRRENVKVPIYVNWRFTKLCGVFQAEVMNSWETDKKKVSHGLCCL